jgi:hypothetical protein
MDGETLRGVFFLLASPAFFFSTVSKEKERERGVFFSCLLACFCFCFVLLSFPRETLGHSFFFFSDGESSIEGKKNFAFSSAPLSPTMAGGGAHEVSILETPIMMLAGVMAFFLVVTGLFEFVSC